MGEHRLIERMIALLEAQARQLSRGGELDFAFVSQAIDFIRNYADHCHHGKEEDILFRDLARKELPPDLKKMMDELVQEHVYARSVAGRLGHAQTAADVRECLEALVEFYPQHIYKEDKEFFFPVMELFSKSEHQAMLKEFMEFDQRLIHEKYANLVVAFEQSSKA